MSGNDRAVCGVLDRVSNVLGGDGGARFAGHRDGGGNQRFRDAGSCPVVDDDDFASRRNRFDPIPDGVLPLAASEDEVEWFAEGVLPRDFLECRLRACAENENNLMHARRTLEAPPSMGDDRLAGDGQEELVHAGPHAGPLASGHDDGGSHN